MQGFVVRYRHQSSDETKDTYLRLVHNAKNKFIKNAPLNQATQFPQDIAWALAERLIEPPSKLYLPADVVEVETYIRVVRECTDERR